MINVKYSDTANGTRVGLLVSNDLNPELIAATLAAYSRSNKSLPQLLQDREDKQLDTSSLCKKIIDGYGHGSIRGLGSLPIFIEGVSLFDAMGVFYQFPYQNGQERSTRYQSLSTFDDLFTPPSLPPSVEKDYHHLIHYWKSNYQSLYSLTKEALTSYFTPDNSIEPKEVERTLNVRTLDCVRFLLPLATKTSLGLVINGTECSQLIKYWLSQPHLSKVANLLISTLDTPGYSNLIRHYHPQPSPTSEIIGLIKHLPFKPWESFTGHSISYIPPANNSVALNYLRLHEPLLQEALSYTFSNRELLYKVADLLALHYNHHHPLDNLGRVGNLTITGLTDVGTLRDLNRHRPIHKLVPLLHPECNMDKELNRPKIDDFYSLPEYLLQLEQLTPLKDKYTKVLNHGYLQILEFFYKWKGELDSSLLSLLTKLTLPQAHLTGFTYSGTLTDWLYLTTLRTQPGGHINYRYLSILMNDLLQQQVPEYKTNCSPVVVSSISDFYNRS